MKSTVTSYHYFMGFILTISSIIYSYKHILEKLLDLSFVLYHTTIRLITTQKVFFCSFL